MVSTSRNPRKYIDYYPVTDPRRMEGWVGLVGWPTADTLPRKLSPVNRRSGIIKTPRAKDRRPNHQATPPVRRKTERRKSYRFPWPSRTSVFVDEHREAQFPVCCVRHNAAWTAVLGSTLALYCNTCIHTNSRTRVLKKHGTSFLPQSQHSSNSADAHI